MPLASFDVFDTLLTRRVGTPESLFLLLGQRPAAAALLRCGAATFAQCRQDAERRARANRAGGEITLRQIYDELMPALGLDPVQAGQLLEQELALEADLSCAVPGAVELVSRARAAAGQVAFVSDMYLPAAFLVGLLERHGFWRAGDRCLVSGEEGKAKATGALYHALARQADCPAADVVHHGNDAWIDGRMARRAGLRTVALPQGNLTRYEQLLAAHAAGTEGFAACLAGAARLARLSVPAADAHTAALRDTAAGVVAPTLVGYTLWVLRRARELGLQRLYFVSRDGQILLRIAQRLAPRLGISCQLSYLYGSRQAWHLSAVTDLGPEQMAWIMDGTDFLSITSLLARVGLTPAEVREHLLALGLAELDWGRNLDDPQRQAVRRLFALAPVRALIADRAAALRGRLLHYLDQEDVLGAAAYGIVDLGWHGRLQDSLARVVAGAGGVTPHGFYFGLHRHAATDDLGPREGYFFDQQRSAGFVDLGRRLICLLEAFCSADHGLVVDYENRDGAWRPVLKDEHTGRLRDWGLATVQRSVLAFVDHLAVAESGVNPWLDVRPVLADVLRPFWRMPTPADAAAWGAFPFENDQGGACWAALAPPYRWRDLAAALWGAELPLPHRGAWIAGSFRRTPVALRLALRLAIRAGRLGRGMWSWLGAGARHLGPPRWFTPRAAVRPAGTAPPIAFAVPRSATVLASAHRDEVDPQT